MEKEVLQKAGLNTGQADVYYELLKTGEMTPTEVAKKTGESRENCYAILKKLEDLHLVEKTEAKKATYRVLNPSNLEILAEKRRKVVAKNEKLVKDNMSLLLDIFYANNEMPGSRTLEGIEGVKEVYKDMLRVGEDVYFIRTQADVVLGYDQNDGFLKKYRDQLPVKGIHTYALTPYSKLAEKNVKNGRDEEINFHRTWMPAEDYEAPVAVQVYGNKVALVSFGETEMATIITSPTIAEAMRQILKIMMKFYQENYPQK